MCCGSCVPVCPSVRSRCRSVGLSVNASIRGEAMSVVVTVLLFTRWQHWHGCCRPRPVVVDGPRDCMHTDRRVGLERFGSVRRYGGGDEDGQG